MVPSGADTVVEVTTLSFPLFHRDDGVQSVRHPLCEYHRLFWDLTRHNLIDVTLSFLSRLQLLQ